MDVVIYDLPERAEETATAEYDAGAPLDVALATAGRIAAAEKLREMAEQMGDAGDGFILVACADELDPDGAR